jgi:hypothetical protein
MATKPRRTQARVGSLETGAGRLPTGAGSDGEDDSCGTYARAPLASIWAVALASGFVALGLTEVIAALVAPRSLRVCLQITTISAVSIVAGIACESTLLRVRSAISDRHQLP